MQGKHGVNQLRGSGEDLAVPDSSVKRDAVAVTQNETWIFLS